MLSTNNYERVSLIRACDLLNLSIVNMTIFRWLIIVFNFVGIEIV